MFRFSGSSQNPGSSVLDELQLSTFFFFFFFGKAGQESITVVHPAGDKGMNKFLQIWSGNKTSNSCHVFETIECWFSYCFNMNTDTNIWLQNHTNILDLILWCLNPRLKVCTHLENFIFVFKCSDFSFLFVLAHPTRLGKPGYHLHGCDRQFGSFSLFDSVVAFTSWTGVVQELSLEDLIFSDSISKLCVLWVINKHKYQTFGIFRLFLTRAKG